jgi:WD40 repeat protein
MDLSQSKNKKNDILFATFNQNYTCFAIGTEKGFYVMDTDPLQERFKRDMDDGGIGIVEMLFKCNIIAIVGGGKNPKYPKNKVMLWDDIQAQCIAELEFSSDVCGVRLRRDKIIVILENKIYIYNFTNLKLFNNDCIRTHQNPKGLCCISYGDDKMILACLGDRPGEVRIYIAEGQELNGPTHFIAHENAISCMALNTDGSRLATASERGTLVRVFDTDNGQKLHEYRRGSQAAKIFSIAFNKDTTALCVSSDTGTVHIYHITNENENYNNMNRKSSLKIMKGIVPIFGSTWSSRQFSVQEQVSICAFGENDENGNPTVIVIGSSGVYHKWSYSSDPSGGEQCSHLTSLSFIETK